MTHPFPETSTPDRERLVALARRSHAVIAGHQDPAGAYPASPTFSAYRGYAWLRDGSFTAEGMSRYGDVGSVERFHDWVTRVLAARTGQVAGLVAAAEAGEDLPLDRMLPTRFTFDGSDGSDPWWDFQTDGYGMWLWAVVTHAQRHGLGLDRWLPGIEVAVDYLTAFWDRPCYDWWEEHVEQRHVSTLGAIHGGLQAIAQAGVLDATRARRALDVAEQARQLVLAEGTTTGRAGDLAAPHLAKWLGSSAVDASLAACVVPFGLVDPASPIAAATLDAVARDLDPLSPTRFGGPFGMVPRFYSSPFVTTVPQAEQAAAALLLRSVGLPYSVDFQAIVNPALEVLDPVEITYDDRSRREIHVVDRLTLPLTAASVMTGATRILSETGDVSES